MVVARLALLLLSASAALVSADEPQLDIAAIAEAGAPPQPSIATNVAAQTVTYDPNQASAAAAASQSAQAADDADGDSPAKVKRAPCDPQQTGAGPVPSPDTAANFKSYPAFSLSASAAPVPTGYDQVFRNLDGENNALGYMGFTLMDSYDTLLCANKCNAIYGCTSFNVAFERSPSKDPSPSGGACEQPPTTTLIKCVFWGGPVSSANAVNRGQWRNNYQVVVAGSNGYVNQTVDTIVGYDTPHYLQSNAISAPNDCNGASTYIGNQYWNDGKPFDTRRCAAACTAQTSASPSNPCRFFNTYIINKGNQPYGQYCAMYTTSWSDSYATLSSTTYNSSTYTITSSYSYTITPYTFTCTKTPSTLSCSNPGACGTYKPCTGNSNTDCICGTDVSSNKVCFRGSTPCTAQSCTANSQCPTGSICLSSNSCCGTSVCAVWNTCTNTQSKRWIFRTRDVATVGGNVFAKRQDDGDDSGSGDDDDDVWTAVHIPASMQNGTSPDDGSGDDSNDSS